MKRFMRRHYREILITVAAVLFVTLACCAIVLIDDYFDGLDAQSADAAKLHSALEGEVLDQAVQAFLDRSVAIARDVPKRTADIEDLAYTRAIVDYLEAVHHADSDIAFFRILEGGEEYDEHGFPFTYTESPYVKEMAEKGTLAVSGLINDPSTGVRGFAVYAPAEEGTGIDGLVVFYYIAALEREIQFEDREHKLEPEYLGLCTVGGEIFSTVYDKGSFGLKQYDNLFLRLRAMINDKPTIDLLESRVHTNDATVVLIDGHKYVISFDAVDASEGMLYTVAVYRSTDVYPDGYRLVSSVYSILIVLALITALLMIYIILEKSRAFGRLEDFETVDHVLQCPTLKGFSARTEMLLSKNKVTKFALIYTKLAHFDYIKQEYGDSVGEETEKFLAKLFEKSLRTDEAFGHVGEAEFALLFHYGEVDDVYNRLKVLGAIVQKCPPLEEQGFTAKLQLGIYFVDREENYTVSKMLDCAMLAHRSKDSMQVGKLHIYDRKIQDSFLHEAEIEAKMEAGLKNGEFKVFFQPKYNISEDRVDGAEALVRWFDPENGRFRSPAEFIPLFETNGFIAEMDHYIFIKVCEYFEESVRSGYKLVPVSVNVSRVTAIRGDFLDFYIQNKKKYGVSDKFLTLEFTESFAFENYEVLSKMVHKLHANGFNCSIDDFGSGYSSFQILKSLPMDELKLDRFFLEKGISKERDDTFLRTIITLAKNMNMVVTQEGVETMDDLHRLEEFGCDVVQGYIYSKPLPITDYIPFLSGGHLKNTGL